MRRAQTLKDLLPLTQPVFHILLALCDEERHGYGIMQDVARQTGEALQLGPGTLYGCLKRMLAAAPGSHVALLQLSTLYLRQHYFVDLIGGWALAAIATLRYRKVS